MWFLVEKMRSNGSVNRTSILPDILRRAGLPVLAVTMAAMMFGGQQALAQCVTDQPFYGSVEVAYKTKSNFNNKPKDEDISAAQTQAVQNAWQSYVGSCMGAGRMQQYLARQGDILRNLDKYLISKQVAHSFDKKSKTITAEALLMVNQPIIDGMFTSTSGGGDGDGAYMVWIFAAKQAGYTKESDVTPMTPTCRSRAARSR